ncbi:ABC transporter ATP-binding protein [Bowmanella denitrificans]|uniref:ABC transporter ATP-binding protein n=1 Tax=Bowmanella denitrificans TaxID=366582 RepID=A0ABP3HQL3_9ALTE
METPLIQIHNLSFRYPKASQDVLNNIELQINQGDYLAIVGTSGSGKSTLLSILGLINPPSQGQYRILGKDTTRLTARSVAQLKNREIGFVFQNFNLLSHLKVCDNVALPLSYNPQIRRRDYRQKVQAALSAVGMQDYARRYPDELSGGQQQRVAIARALVNEPSLILADEPTGNLDSATSEQIFALLQSLNQQGKTICLITHDMDYARQAKRLCRIQDGALSA